MNLSFVQPRSELRPYIRSFWVFESTVGMPQNDTNLAVPNGCPKLIILCENSLETTANGQATISHEGLHFVGNRDVAVSLRSTQRKTSIIGIDFSPTGAFPVFGIPMHKTANSVFQWDSVVGSLGRETWDTIQNLASTAQRVAFIQTQLDRLLDKNNSRNNRLIDFCVKSLEQTNGRMSIRELVQQTGYTRRYLDLLFKQYVGFSPKVLAGIFRFQRFYRKWAEGQPFDILKEEIYDYYYDQSHFTKEFKRITGYSPQRFSLKVANEFGRRLLLG